MSAAASTFNILIASDFFYPDFGGVEIHIYSLAKALVERGHKITILTHRRKNFYGLRRLFGKTKVYYLPHLQWYNGTILPTLFLTSSITLDIIRRENISLVHVHSAFSPLAHEVLVHSSLLGLPTIFTDHSLFGFADFSSIITNAILACTLSLATNVICVSYIGRENTVFRASIEDPSKVYVIPNGINLKRVKDDKDKRFITIVMVNRLYYRKGIDLALEIIPKICSRYSNVRFIIAGDGPKMNDLLAMRQFHRLDDRIELKGNVRHEAVPFVLAKGDIFLNCSLTEVFCMSILEAAYAGLYIITTDVGGIREVLPNDQQLIKFTKPNVSDMLKEIELAIDKVKLQTTYDESYISKLRMKIEKIYNWSDICKRTEKVYQEAIRNHCPKNLLRICLNLLEIRSIVAFFYGCLLCIDYVYLIILKVIL